MESSPYSIELATEMEALEKKSILLPKKFFDSFEQAGTGFVTTVPVASVKKRCTFSLLSGLGYHRIEYMNYPYLYQL